MPWYWLGTKKGLNDMEWLKSKNFAGGNKEWNAYK
jgi:hypothetical protein